MQTSLQSPLYIYDLYMYVYIVHKNIQYLLGDILVANDQMVKPPDTACGMDLSAWGDLIVAEVKTKTVPFMAVCISVPWVVDVLLKQDCT